MGGKMPHPSDTEDGLNMGLSSEHEAEGDGSTAGDSMERPGG